MGWCGMKIEEILVFVAAVVFTQLPFSSSYQTKNDVDHSHNYRNPEYFNVPEDIPLEEAVSNAWEVHGTVLHVGGGSNFYSTVSMNATNESAGNEVTTTTTIISYSYYYSSVLYVCSRLHI